METERTMATHTFAADELQKALKMPKERKKRIGANVDIETEKYVNNYIEFVLKQMEQAIHMGSGPIIFIEQEIDCSKYVPGSSFVCDSIIISGGVLHIILLDLDSVKDMVFHVEGNAKLKLCARAALDMFDGCEHNIDVVTISVHQPQHNRASTHTVFKESIYQWAEEVLAPKKQKEQPQQAAQCNSLTEADFLAELQPIAALLAKKNKDYGNSYAKLRNEYGTVAFHIRLADKLSRLKQVDGNGVLVSDESAIDTIRDIIGYCALELVYRKGGN
jgi:hypothetical protein